MNYLLALVQVVLISPTSLKAERQGQVCFGGGRGKRASVLTLGDEEHLFLSPLSYLTVGALSSGQGAIPQRR